MFLKIVNNDREPDFLKKACCFHKKWIIPKAPEYKAVLARDKLVLRKHSRMLGFSRTF